MRWKAKTAIRQQMRIFKPPAERSRADMRAEAAKAVAEFEARRIAEHVASMSRGAADTLWK